MKSIEEIKSKPKRWSSSKCPDNDDIFDNTLSKIPKWNKINTDKEKSNEFYQNNSIINTPRENSNEFNPSPKNTMKSRKMTESLNIFSNKAKDSNKKLESVSTQHISGNISLDSKKVISLGTPSMDDKKKKQSQKRYKTLVMKKKTNLSFSILAFGISRIIHIQRRVREKAVIENMNKMLCFPNQRLKTQHFDNVVLLDNKRIHNNLIQSKEYDDSYFLELEEMYCIKTAKLSAKMINPRYPLYNIRKKLVIFKQLVIILVSNLL